LRFSAVPRARLRPLDGSTSRFILLAMCVVSATVTALHGTIDGAVYSAVISVIIGGAVHAGGTKQGSEATSSPPPVE
jgi:hypothetical protein